ncbi:MAG: hypothetical protein ACK54C_01920 [Betaproteobacteria bacterium]
MTSKHKTQDTDQGAAGGESRDEPIVLEWRWFNDESGWLTSDPMYPPGGGMQEGQEVKLYTRPSDLQTAPALEKRVRDLEAALRCIRDAPHTTAIILRGLADSALRSK